MNFRKTNPTVRRYIVRIERAERRGNRVVKIHTYLWDGTEVDDERAATHWGAPSHAYLAMDVYGKKVAAEDAEKRKAMFMEIVDTLAKIGTTL